MGATDRALAPVNLIVANYTNCPAVGRNIEPARRPRHNVMALEFLGAPAALTAIAVPQQHKGAETPPAPC